jgi:hypothetical protein
MVETEHYSVPTIQNKGIIYSQNTSYTLPYLPP